MGYSVGSARSQIGVVYEKTRLPGERRFKEKDVQREIKKGRLPSTFLPDPVVCVIGDPENPGAGLHILHGLALIQEITRTGTARSIPVVAHLPEETVALVVPGGVRLHPPLPAS